MIAAIIIAVIVLIPVIAAAMMPEDYVIVNNVTIHRSQQEVFDYLKYLRNGNNFNKWVLKDPDHRKEFTGTDGEPGFIYKWDSDNKGVGKGEQEILRVVGNERIDYQVRFIKPFENVSESSIIVKGVDANTSNVAWSFSGKRNFGMKIFHFLFNLPKALKRDLGESLDNLKTILEGK